MCPLVDKIAISEKGAFLSATEQWGLIRGLETFSQLIHFRGSFAVINDTQIKDYPRFRFRGLMLDTARHYIPVKFIKRTMVTLSLSSVLALWSAVSFSIKVLVAFFLILAHVNLHVDRIA